MSWLKRALFGSSSKLARRNVAAVTPPPAPPPGSGWRVDPKQASNGTWVVWNEDRAMGAFADREFADEWARRMNALSPGEPAPPPLAGLDVEMDHGAAEPFPGEKAQADGDCYCGLGGSWGHVEGCPEGVAEREARAVAPDHPQDELVTVDDATLARLRDTAAQACVDEGCPHYGTSHAHGRASGAAIPGASHGGQQMAKAVSDDPPPPVGAYWASNNPRAGLFWVYSPTVGKTPGQPIKGFQRYDLASRYAATLNDAKAREPGTVPRYIAARRNSAGDPWSVMDTTKKGAERWVGAPYATKSNATRAARKLNAAASA